MSARFEIAHANSQSKEGGYVSPETAAALRDPGGETYRGVAREAHPNHPIWDIIDSYKPKYSGNRRVLVNGSPVYYYGISHNFIIKDDRLNKMVDDIYKKKYWDAIRLGELTNQSLANFIFDMHMGSTTGLIAAVKFLQGKLGLVQDGKIGPNTIKQLNKKITAKLFDELKEFRKQWLKDNVKKIYVKQLEERTDSFFFQEENTGA